MRIKEIQQKELQKRMEEKTLKFIGFITEEQVKSLKKGYVIFRTKSEDLVGDVFGIGNRNVYVYQEVLK